MNEHSLRQALAGLPIPESRYFSSTGSTNDVALEWAAAGAQNGSLVVADTQSAGRGRLGRTWVTRPGAALAFSLVLRPEVWEVERLGLFSPLGALAVSQALEELYGLKPAIKWPNDVLLGGRKMCGILLEASWLGERLLGIITGIGVNVTRDSVPPAGEAMFPATSLEAELGRSVEREALLRAVLEAFFSWRARLASAQFLQAWEERLAFKGEWVRVEQGTRGPAAETVGLTGQVLGVDASGDLRLRDAGGNELRVTVGDVRLRPAARDDNFGGISC